MHQLWMYLILSLDLLLKNNFNLLLKPKQKQNNYSIQNHTENNLKCMLKNNKGTLKSPFCHKIQPIIITIIPATLTALLILTITDKEVRINRREMEMMSISQMELKCHPMLCWNITRMKLIIITIIAALNSPLNHSLKYLNLMCILLIIITTITLTTNNNNNNNYLIIILKIH